MLQDGGTKRIRLKNEGGKKPFHAPAGRRSNFFQMSALSHLPARRKTAPFVQWQMLNLFRAHQGPLGQRWDFTPGM